jgi:aspartate-semialdehyde dehydrogenase
MSEQKKKIPVGILGATGTVGQKLVLLLSHHPWFEIKCLAASSRSAGNSYMEAVQNRWSQSSPVPDSIKTLPVFDVDIDKTRIATQISIAFSAIGIEKEKVKALEWTYARDEIAVLSCNSAHRWTEDVPMILPEVNPDHLDLINQQRENRNWNKGCIVVKPNCSIQSYVPVLHALRSFSPQEVLVSTYQSVSGAGRRMSDWPEMRDNIIPFIPGEEKKSEEEPLKIWGTIQEGTVQPARYPVISATCIRVPVSEGHMASVSVKFRKKPTRDEFIQAINGFENPIADLHLPSSPQQFIRYFDQEDHPQTALNRNDEKGMSIGIGRLREDPVLHWKFVALSHNTLRGASGGIVLTAELMVKKGFIPFP